MSVSKMISHFQATDFSVIQAIFQIGNDWFLRDYEGILYNFEDVTGDGLIFHPLTGWRQKFFLEKDLEVLHNASRSISNY